jgi:L-glutamine-phosphate cytidylyltransferase
MKAIIIAAGKGTRLRPYTEKIPKCLVRLGNKTILSSQIEVFNFFKISNINLITGYKRKKNQIQKFKIFL